MCSLTVKTNKKPAELYVSAGFETLCLPINSAPHTRRRAMRVMVVMMVLSQHEAFKLREAGLRVNSENSIRVIGFPDISPQPAIGSAAAWSICL
jgi:hypothetical protein